MAICAFALNVGCSGSDLAQQDAAPVAPATAANEVENDVENKDNTVSDRYCDDPYVKVSTNSPIALVRASTDSTLRTVTLKSTSKYGYSEGVYNLSDGCFARKGNGYKEFDQLMFNNGGRPTDLSISGEMHLLRDQDAAKFDSITLENLDSLDLKSNRDTLISKAALFDNFIPAKRFSKSRGEEFKTGNVVMAILNDPFSSGKYQLFKMKLVEVQGGERITISYQRLAEANDSDVRDFICSRRTELKALGQKTSGDTTIDPNATRSNFDFETGLNGEERTFVNYNLTGQLSIQLYSQRSSSENATEATKIFASVPAVYDDGSFSRIVAIDDTPLSEVTRASWQPLDQLGSASLSLEAKENTTYLISHFNEKRFLFAAVRILKIDDKGVRLQWKRVAKEPATRFMNFVVDSKSPEATFELATVGSDYVSYLKFPESKARNGQHNNMNRKLKFDAAAGTFVAEARVFPQYAGIIDVTSNYVSLDVIPPSAEDYFTGSFKASESIRMGARYIVAAETYENRSVLAIEVVGFVPGKSVTVKIRLLTDLTTKPLRR